MAEYVVRGAEKNETVLHSQTPNGYEEWRWLPVLERIVRCRDCEYSRKSWNGHKPNFIDDWFCSYTGGHEVKPNGFCYRGKRKESE